MIQKTYLILDTGSNLLKIGKSCNVESRLKALQACCGSKLKLMHYYDVDIENYLHCKFKDFRKHGEWFDIDYKTVIESIDGDSIMSGVVDSKTKNPTALELDRLGSYKWLAEIRIGGRSPINILTNISDLKNSIKKYESQSGKKFSIRGGRVYRIE